MQLTARDIIIRALHHLGVLAVDDTPSATEINQGIFGLNTLVAHYSYDTSLMTRITIDHVLLPVSQVSLTLGETGDFNTEIPLKIVSCRIDNPLQKTLRQISVSEYSQIDFYDRVGQPTLFSHEILTPMLTQLNFWPISDQNYTLIISSQKKIQQIENPSETMNVPEGWGEALSLNLAILLAPGYGRDIPATLQNSARNSLSVMKRSRQNTPILKSDPALISGNKYNIYQGY